MSKLMAYSGISTKVRAMESNLITSNEYSEIMNLSSVNEVVSYLENHRGYKDIFNGIDTRNLHRGDLERVLTLSAYRDFGKLYNFSSLKQRKYLELYFMKYETHLLKQIIREIIDTKKVSIDIPSLKIYFDKFSKLDLKQLSESTTLPELIDSLKDTKYYPPLSRLSSITETNTLFDYELCLDLFYFSTVWSGKEKYLKGNDLDIITLTYGTKIDLLNFQWIYRAKKYYNLTNSQIFAMLIPISYKIKKNELKDLADADMLKTLLELFSNTYYGKYISNTDDDSFLDKLYKELLDKKHKNSFKSNPYSIACMDYYLYLKQNEIAKLVSLTECIRYSYSPDEISNILSN